MGFPASGVLESKYRNDARCARRAPAYRVPAEGAGTDLTRDSSEVADFLNRYFPNRYKVINLSERSYDYTLFNNQVRRRRGSPRLGRDPDCNAVPRPRRPGD